MYRKEDVLVEGHTIWAVVCQLCIVWVLLQYPPGILLQAVTQANGKGLNRRLGLNLQSGMGVLRIAQWLVLLRNVYSSLCIITSSAIAAA